MIHRNRAYIFLLVLLGLFVSCIDEITLDVDSDEQFVIVNGLVADQPGEYSVTVDYSPIIGVGNDNILVPISEARVEVVGDNSDRFTFSEVQDDAGRYMANLPGLQRGVAYHIEVAIPDGTIIRSEPQMIPKSTVEIDTIDFEVINVEFINESGNVATREYVEIYANTLPVQNDGYVRWRVTGEYDIVEKYFGILNPRHCYVKENIDINNIVVADLEDYSGGVIDKEPLVRLPMDSRFHILYLFNVFQYTMSEHEYNYWARIRQLIDVEGTLFDPPPGVLNGNLVSTSDPNQRIQGYFSVVSQSFQRRFVNISERGFFADTDCESRPRANNPEKCVDCTTLPRSTLVKPDYWLF